VQVWRQAKLVQADPLATNASVVILSAGASARRRSCSCRASARCAAAAARHQRWRHDLPGVGENLQDHLQIRAVFKVQGVPHAEHPGQLWTWGKA
jgi:choline dehydrogenase